MKYSMQEAADTISVKLDVVRRAVELGAIVLKEDGFITDPELEGFAAKGFKQHRYDEQGRKLPGAKS